MKETAHPRADAVVWPIIDSLPAHPVVTVAAGVAVTGRTSPAVRNAFAGLVQAGVLVPVAQSKNRSWEATGLLDLIESLETARA